MRLQVFGLNHETASVVEREKALKILKKSSGILLATCNRVELYQMTNDKCRMTNEGIYYYENEEAVRHLFRVAAGLDSRILGETEILGQVRETYLRSQDKDRILDQLFKEAIAAGRRVRQETGLCRGNVSVASTAVSKARELLKNDRTKKILLIGTGKISESVIKTLLKMNFVFILVANRTYAKAKALAKRIGGEAVHFDQLSKELVEADLVISSTAAPHIVLRKKHILARQKPLAIIDLAVPRDVEPEVAALSGVSLLNIDDIREEIDLNLMRRKVEALFAEKIVAEEVRKFCERYVSAPAAAV